MLTAPRIRSVMFVPGNRPDLMVKARRAGADALVLDLEDSVPGANKDEAAAAVAQDLYDPNGPPAFVRVNSPAESRIAEDCVALVPGRLLGVVVPKVETADSLAALDRALSEIENSRGLEKHAIAMVASVETCAGLRSLYDVLKLYPRMRGAGLASAEEGDLMVDIGGQWTPEGEALAYARGRFVCDARAAAVDWLWDGVFMNLSSEDALGRECQLARTFGFTGKFAIHPRQIAVINQAFSPSRQEVERALRMVEAFRASEAAGRGAIQFEGMMVDYANVRSAEQILAMVDSDDAGARR